MTDLVERLREGVIAEAFQIGTLRDGRLAERLIRERHDAADEIERLREEVEVLRSVGGLTKGIRPMLTPEQRYRQAIAKARLISRRSVRKVMAGEIDETPCTMDLERKFLIEEIDRAYKDGRASVDKRA